MEITDKKIIDLMKDKDTVVSEGRKVSKEIEKLEKKIAKLDKKERAITDQILCEDLVAEGEALKDVINKQVEELGEIAKKIQEKKLAAIPEAMAKEHYALRDEKEKLEKERAKLALKVQKIKDKVVPLIQKQALPTLGEFEDLAQAELKGDKVVLTIVDKIEEWKNAWKKSKNEIASQHRKSTNEESSNQS